ncbi:MAG: hypothetical protein A2Z18_07150 [Armatimonadetes bacterium RBG_16_58_9]|nr:MAG: hypothetical protein A2Z18_07150 [Armatimonadetes bacterium RBG_16_58_9]
MSHHTIQDRAKNIIKGIQHVVLVTIDQHGMPQPRSMWLPGMDDDFTIYFVTSRRTEKCPQIAANSKVCVFWTQVQEGQLGQGYVSLKGEASLTDDQNLRYRFWNDELNQYFPGGKDDPDYVIIVIKPKELLVMDSMKYPLDKVEF